MKNKFIILSIVLLLTIGLNCGLYYKNIDDVVEDYAETYVSNLAVRILFETLEEYLKEKGINYFDIVTINTDTEGNAKVLTVNSGLLTKIRSETSILLTDKFDNLKKKNLSIPLGTLYNSKLLSGIGPSIKIKIVPLGYITSETKNEFVSVGINQSKHNISIIYNITLNVLAPFASASITQTQSITIAESIIIGDVPNTSITVGEGSSAKTDYYIYP